VTIAELAVVATCVAAILWVNWYFFLAGRGAARAVAGTSGVQELRVIVRGGYEPAHLVVRRGTPVRLVFNRQETDSCSEEVVLPDFGVRRFLPAFQETAVEFTPESTGTHEFTCGMGMLRGKVTVEE